MEQPYHTPVLLPETMDGLQINPAGIYVDCTLGGGGHARSILAALNEKGRLVAFDQDADAQRNIPDDKRVVFVNQNFRHLQKFLRLQNILSVDGILADLGVSSHQFDSAERGFSTRFNADLDMRMDKRQAISAKDVIATFTEKQLHKIFEAYGEVTNAKTLARTIVEVREKTPIQTIDDLKNAVREIVKGNPNKYFAQVFQALRITVNEELEALQELLQQVPVLLKPGGRVTIITFHSLEDRLVKNFFRRGTTDEPGQNPFINDEPVNALKVITKKPVVPSEKEINLNPRARSAKLRIAEKKN